jgi:hypothetical protein
MSKEQNHKSIRRVKPGMVDSASITCLVGCLQCNNLNTASRVAYRSSIEATSVLLLNRSFGIAPPKEQGSSSGDFAVLQETLPRLLSHVQPTLMNIQQANKYSDEWFDQSQHLIRPAFWAMYANKDFQLWLEHEIQFIWRHHARSQKGLFNPGLIPKIAVLLNNEEKHIEINEEELLRLQKLSGDDEVIEEYVKRHPDNDEFNYTKLAYVAAFVLRTSYQDKLAELMDYDILHQILRRENKEYMGEVRGVTIPLEKEFVVGCFAHLLIEAARQNSPEYRAAAFASHLSNAREMAIAKELDQRKLNTGDELITALQESFLKLGLDVNKRWIFETIDMAIAMAAPLTTIVLNTFNVIPSEFLAYSSVAAELIIWKELHHKNIEARLRDSNARRNVQKAIDAISAGRVEGKWEP